MTRLPAPRRHGQEQHPGPIVKCPGQGEHSEDPHRHEAQDFHRRVHGKGQDHGPDARAGSEVEQPGAGDSSLARRRQQR